jgi:hypothetical protein
MVTIYSEQRQEMALDGAQGSCNAGSMNAAELSKTSNGAGFAFSRDSFLMNGFLPLIDPTEPRRLWRFWPEIEVEAIAINYLKLRKNQELLERCRSEGIKRALGYDGKVVAVLVGDNYHLDCLQVHEYADDLDQMGFDAATTHDDYVYPDDRLSAQWSRLHTMLDRATKLKRLDPDSELIGIVQGARVQQLEFCVESLLRIGIRRLALPCSDLAARKTAGPIIDFSRICQERDLWHWLVGINSQAFMTRFQSDAVSGYGWCYRGAKGQIYRDGSLVKVASRGFCRHGVCRELAAKSLSLPELCTRHNLQYLLGIMRRGSHELL